MDSQPNNEIMKTNEEQKGMLKKKEKSTQTDPLKKTKKKVQTEKKIVPLTIENVQPKKKIPETKKCGNIFEWKPYLFQHNNSIIFNLCDNCIAKTNNRVRCCHGMQLVGVVMCSSCVKNNLNLQKLLK